MKHGVVKSTLVKMVNRKHLRKLLVKKLDDYIYKTMVEENSEDLKKMQDFTIYFSPYIRNCGMDFS